MGLTEGLRMNVSCCHARTKNRPHLGRGEDVTKADLVEQVADAIGPPVTKKACKEVIEAFLASVQDTLVRGEGIEIRDSARSRCATARPAPPATPEPGSRSKSCPAARRSSNRRASSARGWPGGRPTRRVDLRREPTGLACSRSRSAERLPAWAMVPIRPGPPRHFHQPPRHLHPPRAAAAGRAGVSGQVRHPRAQPLDLQLQGFDPAAARLRRARSTAAVPFRTARTTSPRRSSAAVPSRSFSSLLTLSTASSRAARPR